jgi:multidrug efflux pump subunit AcrA (membrane-fusion protein)
MPKKPLTSFMFILSLFVTALASPAAGDEQKPPEKKGPPPAIVAVEDAVMGLAEPMNEFIGTVFYSHVSDIASEVAGKVAGVGYDEGEKVRKGQILVRLGNEILQTRVDATRASHEQALIELEQAGKDLARMEALFKAESISESLYDEKVFRVRRLEKRPENSQPRSGTWNYSLTRPRSAPDSAASRSNARSSRENG